MFARLGSHQALLKKAADYCLSHENCRELLAVIGPELPDDKELDATDDEVGDTSPIGFVYLLRSGRHYKIGHTADLGRRRYDLAIQLPDPITEEHVIRTDDPRGIETGTPVSQTGARTGSGLS